MASILDWSKFSIVKNVLRIATGSKIFFPPERRCGGGFQKMVLRKIL